MPKRTFQGVQLQCLADLLPIEQGRIPLYDWDKHNLRLPENIWCYLPADIRKQIQDVWFSNYWRERMKYVFSEIRVFVVPVLKSSAPGSYHDFLESPRFRRAHDDVKEQMIFPTWRELEPEHWYDTCVCGDQWTEETRTVIYKLRVTASWRVDESSQEEQVVYDEDALTPWNKAYLELSAKKTWECRPASGSPVLPIRYVYSLHPSDLVLYAQTKGNDGVMNKLWRVMLDDPCCSNKDEVLLDYHLKIVSD
jgi:hypothetical protein